MQFLRMVHCLEDWVGSHIYGWVSGGTQYFYLGGLAVVRVGTLKIYMGGSVVVLHKSLWVSSLLSIDVGVIYIYL